MEEIDRLFLDKVPLRKFNKVQISVEPLEDSHDVKDGDGKIARLEIVESEGA